MSFSQGEDGELVNTIVPNLSKQAILENQGLLVDGGQAKSLFISSSWTAAEALEWLREKLPKPFTWLDANISPSSPPYRLLIKTGTRFSLCASENPTGYELNKYRGGSGKSWTARQVWIGALQVHHTLYLYLRCW
jgi:hypothetical protein